MGTHNSFKEETTDTAAIWWTHLREPNPSADLLERWNTWMADDPANAQAFAQLNTLSERAAHAPAEQRRQLIDEFAPRAVSRRRHPLMAAAAAVFGIALLGGWWVLHSASDRVGSSQQYASAVGENRTIQLPDGSAVELGAASTLRTHFARSQRAVELDDGEAFFTVTHDHRPFVVDAGPLRIEDLGTAFNVRRTGQRVSVTVTQGRVRLSPADGTSRSAGHPSGRLDLTAGQRAEYDPTNGALSVSEIAPEHAATWREQRLEFIDEPMSAVIANVNRYSHQPIRFADPRLGELKFTGTVNTTTIGSWVGGLPHVFPVQVHTFADHVVLSSAGQP
ncbi:MAG: FecR domain-containing protein [Rhodanobacter sp.]